MNEILEVRRVVIALAGATGKAKMMKAAVVEEAGGPEVLLLQERPLLRRMRPHNFDNRTGRADDSLESKQRGGLRLTSDMSGPRKRSRWVPVTSSDPL